MNCDPKCGIADFRTIFEKLSHGRPFPCLLDMFYTGSWFIFRKSKSAKECGITHLPKRIRPGMDGARMGAGKARARGESSGCFRTFHVLVNGTLHVPWETMGGLPHGRVTMDGRTRMSGTCLELAARMCHVYSIVQPLVYEVHARHRPCIVPASA